MHNWLRCLRSGAHLGAISPQPPAGPPQPPAGPPQPPAGAPAGARPPRPPPCPPAGAPPWGVGMGCRDVSAFNTVTRSGCYKQSAASARSGGRAMLTKTSCNRRQPCVEAQGGFSSSNGVLEVKPGEARQETPFLPALAGTLP